MACGDVTPNTIYLPSCGLAATVLRKESFPPGGSVILPGTEVTWRLTVETYAEFPDGLQLEDIFEDCDYLGTLVYLTPGWAPGIDFIVPCRFTLEADPASLAPHPGIHVVEMTFIVGLDLSVDEDLIFEGFGTLVNTANVLSPDPVAGETNTLIFGPSMTGAIGDLEVGVPIYHFYQIRSGVGPFVVSLHLGELPPGLSLAPNGVITGTPTTPGDYSFTLKLTDSNGNIFLLPDDCDVLPGPPPP